MMEDISVSDRQQITINKDWETTRVTPKVEQQQTAEESSTLSCHTWTTSRHWDTPGEVVLSGQSRRCTRTGKSAAHHQRMAWYSFTGL